MDKKDLQENGLRVHVNVETENRIINIPLFPFVPSNERIVTINAWPPSSLNTVSSELTLQNQTNNGQLVYRLDNDWNQVPETNSLATLEPNEYSLNLRMASKDPLKWSLVLCFRSTGVQTLHFHIMPPEKNIETLISEPKIPCTVTLNWFYPDRPNSDHDEIIAYNGLNRPE